MTLENAFIVQFGIKASIKVHFSLFSVIYVPMEDKDVVLKQFIIKIETYGRTENQSPDYLPVRISSIVVTSVNGTTILFSHLFIKVLDKYDIYE